MRNTLQTEGLTVLEHGEMVWEVTKKIISGQWDGMKLPDWFIQNHRYICNNLHSPDIIKAYNVYHDCGKPFCLVIDDQGRHFPNHAEVSKQTWSKYSSNELVATLIGMDMHLHTCKAVNLLQVDLTQQDYFTLLVTAFAEIHANAQLFGGIDSISFKMKWKKLNQRGKALLREFPEKQEHPYCYVVVRRDLNHRQKAVQGTHAAIEMTKVTPSIQSLHPSVIYVQVRNEKKLKEVMAKLLEMSIKFCSFVEPDLNNEFTAICTEPLVGEKRAYLKRFQLLNFD